MHNDFYIPNYVGQPVIASTPGKIGNAYWTGSSDF